MDDNWLDDNSISDFVNTSDAVNGEFIPMYKGRPRRKRIIQKDEIINFVIFINTAKDWEEFLFNI